MEERVKKALELHHKGYNCAQAVACAYCDKVGLDEETMFRIVEGLGAGMGGMQATCGAVSGAVVLAGLKNSRGYAQPLSKGATYRLSREIVRQFSEKNTTVVCSELKGLESKSILRSCDGCVEDAVRIAGSVLFGE